MPFFMPLVLAVTSTSTLWRGTSASAHRESGTASRIGDGDIDGRHRLGPGRLDLGIEITSTADKGSVNRAANPYTTAKIKPGYIVIAAPGADADRNPAQSDV